MSLRGGVKRRRSNLQYDEEDCFVVKNTSAPRNDIYNPNTFRKSTVIRAVAPQSNSPS